MEREKWKENCNINSNNNGNTNGYFYDRFVCDDYDGEVPSAERSPAKPSSLSSSPPRLGYIEHHVSKYDTLAGVAIKYGVEVLLLFNFFFFYLLVYFIISALYQLDSDCLETIGNCVADGLSARACFALSRELSVRC